MANAHNPAQVDIEALKSKYQKVYKITPVIDIDDETTVEKVYYFRKPNVASYDRYVKSASGSMTRALKVFLLDNIVEEQRELIEADLEEYPALTMSLGEKLLSLLGLSKTVNLRVL